MGLLFGACMGGGTTESDATRWFGVSSVSFTGFSAKLSRDAPIAFWRPCRRDPVATPPGIARRPRPASLAIHRGAPANHERRHGKASRSDPECSPNRPSNLSRLRPGSYWRAPAPHHVHTPDEDRLDLPALPFQSPAACPPVYSGVPKMILLPNSTQPS